MKKKINMFILGFSIGIAIAIFYHIIALPYLYPTTNTNIHDIGINQPLVLSFNSLFELHPTIR